MSRLRRLGIGLGVVGFGFCFLNGIAYRFNNPQLTETQLSLDGDILLWSLGALICATVAYICWRVEIDEY